MNTFNCKYTHLHFKQASKKENSKQNENYPGGKVLQHIETVETLTQRLFSQAFLILKKENSQDRFCLCLCNTRSSPVFLFAQFLICHSGRCKTSLSADLFLAASSAPDFGCLPFFMMKPINCPKNCLCFQVKQRLHPAVPGILKFLYTPNTLRVHYVLLNLSVKGTKITHSMLNLDHF